MTERAKTTFEFTPKQVQEALIWYYNLPEDTKFVFRVKEDHDYYDQPLGPAFSKVEATFHQELKTRKAPRQS